MQYTEFHPGPPLNRFVECIWTLGSDDDQIAATPERILPDGCVELILNFGSPFSQHTNSHKRVQPRNFVVGQMTGPILISPTGQVDLIGIRFQPGGAVPFLRLPMSEITDQVVELGGLSSKLERQLLSSCFNVTSTGEKVSAIISCLAGNLPISHDSNLMVLAETIVNTGGIVSVERLANEAGISSRQLERRFMNGVGLGPKLLSRILRFQQVFRAVERSDSAWADVAVECGYYDQAHLIRDFNKFANQTPAVLFAERSPLTEAFTRKRRTSHFSNTLG